MFKVCVQILWQKYLHVCSTRGQNINSVFTFLDQNVVNIFTICEPHGAQQSVDRVALELD